jgi:hypothetical protein
MMLKDRLEIKSKLANQERPLEYLCATVKFAKTDQFSVLNRVARCLREAGRPYFYILTSFTNIRYIKIQHIKNRIQIQQYTRLPTNRHELYKTTHFFLDYDCTHCLWEAGSSGWLFFYSIRLTGLGRHLNFPGGWRLTEFVNPFFYIKYLFMNIGQEKNRKRIQ